MQAQAGLTSRVGGTAVRTQTNGPQTLCHAACHVPASQRRAVWITDNSGGEGEVLVAKTFLWKERATQLGDRLEQVQALRREGACGAMRCTLSCMSHIWPGAANNAAARLMVCRCVLQHMSVSPPRAKQGHVPLQLPPSARKLTLSCNSNAMHFLLAGPGGRQDGTGCKPHRHIGHQSRPAGHEEGCAAACLVAPKNAHASMPVQGGALK